MARERPTSEMTIRGETLHRDPVDRRLGVWYGV